MPLREIATAEGFVLAGGRSSRMGTDKALALFAGKPLIATALATLRDAGLQARIAGSRSPLDAYGEPIPDTFTSAGPLAGIHAALTASASDLCVFLPVDMPLMPPALLRCLLQRARLTGAPVTVARLNGRVEPFPVVLSRQTAPYIVERLKSEHASCHAAWREIPALLGEQPDAVSIEHLVSSGHLPLSTGIPPIWCFLSANTPSDLAWMSRLWDRIQRLPGEIA